MQKVYVVIPNWNGEPNLARCLDSLAPQIPAENIILVDNASSDSSVDMLKSKYPQVTLMQNKRNLGFAGGVNTGIRFALSKHADYVGLLNNDAVADKT